MDGTMTDSDCGTIDHSALDRLVRFGGNKLVSDMIGIFIADAPGRIAGARAGVRADDAGAVARALHALKSSAGQLGAHQMMACCEAGEMLANLGDTAALRAAVADVELAFASVRSQLEVHAATLRVA